MKYPLGGHRAVGAGGTTAAGSPTHRPAPSHASSDVHASPSSQGVCTGWNSSAAQSSPTPSHASARSQLPTAGRHALPAGSTRQASRSSSHRLHSPAGQAGVPPRHAPDPSQASSPPLHQAPSSHGVPSGRGLHPRGSIDGRQAKQGVAGAESPVATHPPAMAHHPLPGRCVQPRPTDISTHSSVVHASPSSQSESLRQEKRQSGSQPSPDTAFASSHSSPSWRVPSPQLPPSPALSPSRPPSPSRSESPTPSSVSNRLESPSGYASASTGSPSEACEP